MSQIKVKCPNASCGKVLGVDNSLAGKKGKCSGCGTVFQIPGAAGAKPSGEKTPRPEGKSPAAPAAAKPRTGQKSAPSPRPAASPGRQAPPAGSAGRRAEPKRKPRDADPRDDDVLDAEFLEEDDAPAEEPPRRRGPAASARKRRPPAEDEYEDYEDYEDYEADAADDVAAADDFEDYEDYDDRPARRPAGRARAPRKRGISTAQRWQRVSVGMLIAAISTCVLAGAFGFTLLMELLVEVALLNAASGEAESARGLSDAAQTIYKIARVFAGLGLVGAVAGFAFFTMAPPRNGALGWGIATLVIGSGWFIVELVFRLLRAFDVAQLTRAFSRNVIYDTAFVAVSAGELYRSAGDLVLCLLFELLGVACLILLSLFLASVARAQKDRGHAADCMKPVWILSGYIGTIVLLYVFAFVDWEIEPGAGIPWWVYISWLIHWAANVLYAIALVFVIKALFYSRRTTG